MTRSPALPLSSHCWSPLLESNHVGSWEERGFERELVTSNASESFNAALKRVQQWKEAPIDAMALVLYRMAQAFDTEIQRGRVGLGDYKLRQGLSPQTINTESISTPVAFDDIVDRVRNGVLPSTSSSDSETRSASVGPSTSQSSDVRCRTGR